MKILMVHSFHHQRGGDSTYVAGLTRLLEQQGHVVIPLAMRHPRNRPSVWEPGFVSQVDFRSSSRRMRLRSAARAIYNPEAAEACAILIARQRPDIVHLHHVHHHLTPAVLGPARRAGLPVVWTVHDYELICPQGHLYDGRAPCTACRGHQYQNALRKRCKNGSFWASALAALENALHAWADVPGRVDRFLCPSRFLAQKLRSFGIPASRIQTLHNFVEAPETPPASPGSGWVFAGRLETTKGIHTVLEAAKRTDWPLTILGDGTLREQVRQVASELPHVTARGHVDLREVAETLSTAGAVVVPSVWWENFPFAVTEAQGLGRAVVASRIGGIPEQIRQNVDGLLVPPGDAAALVDSLERLRADSALRSRLGRTAHARVQVELSPARHVHEVLRHYRELL